MPGSSHQDLLVDTINEYLREGYSIQSLGTDLYSGYRPDAVLRKGEQMVVVEITVSSDRVRDVEEIKAQFPDLQVKLDKRQGKPGGRDKTRYPLKGPWKTSVNKNTLSSPSLRTTIPLALAEDVLGLEAGDTVHWELEWTKDVGPRLRMGKVGVPDGPRLIIEKA